jgi:hypothetical protein
MALFERGAAIDYHTVADELVRHGTYQAAGGVLALAELNVATPTSAHIVHYARIVADYALRRRFVDTAQRVTELACDVGQEIDGVRQRSMALMLGASNGTLAGQEVLAPETWTDHLLDYLERGRTGGIAGVSTGLRDLDTMTLGLSPGLYLLAASTGTGKTAVQHDVRDLLRFTFERAGFGVLLEPGSTEPAEPDDLVGIVSGLRSGARLLLAQRRYRLLPIIEVAKPFSPRELVLRVRSQVAA